MKQRKALSPIISSVLVLAVALSLVSIYAQWAPSFTENVTERVANQQQHDIKCSNAAFSIRNASYDKTAQELKFDLENTGTIRFTQEVFMTAVNGSRTIGRATVKGLEVGETRTVTIESDRIPSNVITTSADCPDLKDEQTFIDVSK